MATELQIIFVKLASQYVDESLESTYHPLADYSNFAKWVADKFDVEVVIDGDAIMMSDEDVIKLRLMM